MNKQIIEGHATDSSDTVLRYTTWHYITFLLHYTSLQYYTSQHNIIWQFYCTTLYTLEYSVGNHLPIQGISIQTIETLESEAPYPI